MAQPLCTANILLNTVGNSSRSALHGLVVTESLTPPPPKKKVVAGSL